MIIISINSLCSLLLCHIMFFSSLTVMLYWPTLIQCNPVSSPLYVMKEAIKDLHHRDLKQVSLSFLWCDTFLRKSWWCPKPLQFLYFRKELCTHIMSQDGIVFIYYTSLVESRSVLNPCLKPDTIPSGLGQACPMEHSLRKCWLSPTVRSRQGHSSLSE